MSRPKTKITVSEAKKLVLDAVMYSCEQDRGYFYDTLLWAYRDYTPQNWAQDFFTMEIGPPNEDFEIVFDPIKEDSDWQLALFT
jgi:hypothetical protein